MPVRAYCLQRDVWDLVRNLRRIATLLTVRHVWQIIPEDKLFHLCSSNNELSRHLDNVRRHCNHTSHSVHCKWTRQKAMKTITKTSVSKDIVQFGLYSYINDVRSTTSLIWTQLGRYNHWWWNCQLVKKGDIQPITSSSAVAEGPRDVLVSRNSATTKYRYRVALFAWSYV